MLRSYLLNLNLTLNLVVTVAKLTSYSDTSQSISMTEVCKCLTGNKAAFVDAVMNEASIEYYKLHKSLCNASDINNLKRLYLAIYALESWSETEKNWLSEEQLMAILSNIEQISKSCCNG